jgi:hypothetical protein
MEIRQVKKIIRSVPVTEGAGVHLKRAFGFGKTSEFDPFLLLDDFRSSNSEEYKAGFPWHPHRGIETITYMLDGRVEHQDSLGNKGHIKPGEVQWMTAGSGIIHQEMPEGNDIGTMGGFQLWANLPAKHKMMDPRYREVKEADIPEVALKGGGTVRVIAGEVEGIRGPVTDIIIEPEYLDVSLPTHTSFTHRTHSNHTVFCYVIDGFGNFLPEATATAKNGELVLFESGEEVAIRSVDMPLRFLFISGAPLREPVAWYGPIVMNTQQEIEIAMQELRTETFIKYK